MEPVVSPSCSATGKAESGTAFLPAAAPKPLVWGEYRAHSHDSVKNVLNGVLCLVALMPSYVVTAVLYERCNPSPTAAQSWASLSDGACALAMGYPLWFANALFFGNVTVGFWLVGLAQRSFWLIDPYWTIIPPLLGQLYRAHPRAEFDEARSAVSLVLLWLWSARLTHSYFRREEWKFGQREDWRYTKMAKDWPRLWPVLSFFAVGLAQQPMLVGITLPAYTVHLSADAARPFGAADAVATALCAAGLLVAKLADDQLRAYMLANEALVAAGRPKRTLLETGLWRYSRHPNYFGEQLWWWSFGLFAVLLGQWYMLGGALFNSIVLASVTVMTERRMLDGWEPARAEQYRGYMRRTSPCIPWWGHIVT
eukprot:g366.t1